MLIVIDIDLREDNTLLKIKFHALHPGKLPASLLHIIKTTKTNIIEVSFWWNV